MKPMASGMLALGMWMGSDLWTVDGSCMDGLWTVDSVCGFYLLEICSTELKVV